MYYVITSSLLQLKTNNKLAQDKPCSRTKNAKLSLQSDLQFTEPVFNCYLRQM